MSDRKALVKALDWYADMTYLDEKDEAMVTAARERLAQLPEDCPACALIKRAAVLLPVTGLRAMADDRGPCLMCHGSGEVYPAELVERIARTLRGTSNPNLLAVAVLDALSDEGTD